MSNATYTYIFSAIPTAHNAANHAAEFATAAATQEAHDETIKVSKALALTGFRVIDDEDFFRKVRAPKFTSAV